MLYVRGIIEKMQADKETVAVISALLFASEDYCASTGIIKTRTRRELLFPRAQMATIAKAFNLAAIDMVCIDDKDINYLSEECNDGKELGFDGRQAIHPAQVEAIQSAFAPSPKDQAPYNQSVKENKGAYGLQEGDSIIMIDAPMLYSPKRELRISRLRMYPSPATVGLFLLATMNKITYHFDCVSPWSFVGFDMLKRYKKLWNLDVEYRAVNQGYIIKFSANRPPMAVPNKGAYMFSEMQRTEKFFGLKLEMPAAFPVNTQYMQMVLRTIQDDLPTLIEASMTACFLAIWKHDLPCKTRQDMISILSPVLGPTSAAQIVEKAFTGDVKSKLNKESEKLATDQGLFGVPWMMVQRSFDGETSNFFGSDRFEQIAAFLNVPYRGPFADGVTPKL